MPDIVNEQAASAGNDTASTGSTDPIHAPAQSQNNNNNNIPLVFMRETELFGTRRPERSEWVQHVEVDKAIGQRIEVARISGLQRVRGMWRIYLDNLEDKVKLMAEGIPLRGKVIPVLNTNPDRLDGEQTTKIRVKNVPLSADDGVIKRVITLTGADVITLYREKLRVDSKLTNCETGDRILLVKTSSLKEPLPTFMTFGSFTGRVYHIGQSKQNNNRPLKCSKCLQDGHTFKNCQHDWVCSVCKEPGHKRVDCPKEKDSKDDSGASESESSDEESESETPESPRTATELNVTKSPVKKDANRRIVKPSKSRQQSMERFMTPDKPVLINNKAERSPPTPTEVLHDQLHQSQKKMKKNKHKK